MVLQCCPQSIDRIERGRRYMIERAPVIGNEVLRSKALEQSERVSTRQMSLTEPGLPPRSMSDWQKRQIEMPPLLEQLSLHQVRRVRHQRRISGEKARNLISIQQIHIRGAAPPIYTIAVALVGR